MLRPELLTLAKLSQTLLDAGEPGLVATLIAARGSSYRPLGSMMVSGPPGLRAGGVSGGCLEDYIARVGREILRDKPGAVLSFDTDRDAEPDKPVLGCGGELQILIEPLSREHLALFETLADPDRDDLTLEITFTDPSNAIITRRLETGCLSSAETDRRYAFPSHKRLAILGAGDDVQSVVRFAHELGYIVAVIDPSSRKATALRFPEAQFVINDGWRESIARLKHLDRTAIVLMTHSYPDDLLILQTLAPLSSSVRYLGVLGPRHRKTQLLAELEASLPPETYLELAAALHGPIGLPLRGRGAPYVALSLLAELSTGFDAQVE